MINFSTPASHDEGGCFYLLLFTLKTMSINCIEPQFPSAAEISAGEAAAKALAAERKEHQRMSDALEDPNLDPILRAAYAKALLSVVIPT